MVYRECDLVGLDKLGLIVIQSANSYRQALLEEPG